MDRSHNWQIQPVQDPFDPERPLTDIAFALFDVETTGISPNYGHRVCEVACVRTCDSVELETLERPDFDYRRKGAFDMEASGFYPTALRFSQPQLVHCLKVISDNREQSGRGISGADVRRLIEQRLALLEDLMVHLTTLAAQSSEDGKR